MFNNLRAAYEPAIDALATVLSAEVSRVDSYRDLAEAITSGGATRAKQWSPGFCAWRPTKCSR
jgi:GntR family transcriptional repressor for pyruvate dehydrogenase complex